MQRLIITLLLFFIGLAQAQHDGDFVEISSINHKIVLDIRYATADNFLGKAVYAEARCFVRRIVALKLDSIQQELEKLGLGLKIYDGYRPLSVQKMMWKIMPDNRYVADPQNGSRHNRGAAVDITLVDSLGKELQMPTAFDDFTRRAHHNYQNFPAEVRINRWILRTIMEKYGFKPISSEWWHYDLKGWRRFDIVDKPFDELTK